MISKITKLSIVIPAYNEEKMLGETIRRIHAHMNTKGYSSEIIVVDDRSTDATQEILLKSVAQGIPLRLISHLKNSGKGAAVRTGIMASTGSHVLFLDADHSVNITNIDIFAGYMSEGYEVVVASIGIPGARIHDVHHNLRRVAGSFSKKLIKFFATPGIEDTQRGFKLFTEKAAHDLFMDLKILRWGFDIEILVRAQRRGYRIKEVPVQWNNRKISDISLIDYIQTLFELIGITSEKIRGKYDE